MTRILSAGLLALGAVLLLAALLLQLYTFYAEVQWQRAQVALSSQFLPVSTPTVEATAQEPPPASARTATPTPAGIGAALQPTAVAAATPTPTPISSPTPTTVRLPSPSPTPDDRSNPGRLLIPRLNVNAAIVPVPLVNGQWDVSSLIYDVGLLAGTGFPGRPGNAAISGHVSLRGRGDGPFRWLERLTPGDEVIVEQKTKRYLYQVVGTRVVLPSDVSVLAPTEGAVLTLITCTDWDWLRAEYSKRLIVTANLVGQTDVGAAAQ